MLNVAQEILLPGTNPSNCFILPWTHSFFYLLTFVCDSIGNLDHCDFCMPGDTLFEDESFNTWRCTPIHYSGHVSAPNQPSPADVTLAVSLVVARRLLLCRLSYEAFASFLCKVHIWSGGWLVCGFEQVSQLTESGQVHFIWISAGFLIKKYCQSSGMEGLSSLHDDVPKVALFHFSLGFLRWMDVNSLVYI